MFNILFSIIGAVGIAYTWVNVVLILNWIRKWQVRNKTWVNRHCDVIHDHDSIRYDTWYSPKRIKPFDCEQCLAFWLTPVLYFTIENPIICLFSASCVAVMLISVFNSICTYKPKITKN